VELVEPKCGTCKLHVTHFQALLWIQLRVQKVKTMEGKGVGAHSLVHSTLWVEGRAGASGWD